MNVLHEIIRRINNKVTFSVNCVEELDDMVREIPGAEVFAEVKLCNDKMRACPIDWIEIQYDEPGIARIQWGKHLEVIGYNEKSGVFDRYSSAEHGADEGVECDLYKVAVWNEGGVTIEVSIMVGLSISNI